MLFVVAGAKLWKSLSASGWVVHRSSSSLNRVSMVLSLGESMQPYIRIQKKLLFLKSKVTFGATKSSPPTANSSRDRSLGVSRDQHPHHAHQA